jgi:hypothetical protein
VNNMNSQPAPRGLPIRRALIGLLLTSLFAVTAAQASESPSVRHTFFMRGQIVEVLKDTVVVCIGRADGASVGQELDVVHHRRVSGAPKGKARFKREVVGKVRINEIVDDHYAEATVISGKARRHYSVELARSAD